MPLTCLRFLGAVVWGVIGLAVLLIIIMLGVVYYRRRRLVSSRAQDPFRVQCPDSDNRSAVGVACEVQRI